MPVGGQHNSIDEVRLSHWLDNQSKFFTRRFVSEACPLEAESIKPRYALYHQLPRAILLDMF
jgi:hypothetical protein